MRFAICVFFVAAAGMESGCSSPAGVEGLVPVTGKVTYQGKPVEGATASFSPEAEGRSASAITEEDGTFELTTQEAGDGALPGAYKVGISKTEEINPMSSEERQKYFHEHMGRMPPSEYRDLLPEKYKNLNTSGLTAQVKASGENDFTFDLAD